MESKKLYLLTIEAAAAGLQAGDFTSVELTEACLAHIERFDTQLNCFVRLEPDFARKLATESDERRSSADIRGIIRSLPTL